MLLMQGSKRTKILSFNVLRTHIEDRKSEFLRDSDIDDKVIFYIETYTYSDLKKYMSHYVYLFRIVITQKTVILKP